MRAFLLLVFALLVGCGISPEAHVTIRHVIWQTGPSQSNGWGVNPGETGPDIAEVPYWDTLIGTSASTALHALQGGHGKDYGVGRQLLAAGYNPILVNISEGSTFSNEWIPPTEPTYLSMVSEVEDAWAAIQADFPGDTFVHHHASDQGEAEARYGWPEPDAAEIAVVNAWADNFEATHTALESLVGPMHRFVIQTNSNIEHKTLPGVLEALQLEAAMVEGPATRLINRNNEAGVAYEGNNVHLTTAGYITLGNLFVAAFIENNPMGTLSTYTLNGALEHVLGVSTFPPAVTHYLAAFVAGTEVTGGAYARKAVTNNTTNWPNAAARVKSLGVEQSFVTAAGANWGAVDEIRIYDASSGGNELARDALASSVTIDDGETLVIEAGAIDITAAAGALSDDLAEAILDHVFGSVDITPEATVQFAYFDGDPQGAGVEITGTSYARIVHDNDGVTWSTAASGVVRNLINFAFPTAGAADWDTADYWALFNAAGTGLMFSAALPAARAVGNGETETIAANRIRPTFA